MSAEETAWLMAHPKATHEDYLAASPSPEPAGSKEVQWKLMPRVSIEGADGPNWREQPWHPNHDFVTVDYLNALESALSARDARIRELETLLATTKRQFRFIVNILGPTVPDGLPDGADVEWGEALAAADVGLELSSPSTGEKTAECCCPDCENYCPVHQPEMWAKAREQPASTEGEA